MALRVVFFGNSQSVFSNRHFAALLDTPCDLAGVVDAPPSKRSSTNPLTGGIPVFVQVARRRSIPVFEPSSPNLPQFVAAMGDLSPDLFIAVGYTNVLKAQVLSVPRIVAANFHASLLPAYRGKHPVFWTLRGGERRAGLTVHVMDPGIDTGDVLYQVSVPTRKDDTVATLYDRIMDKGVALVGRLAEDAGSGRLRCTPQAEAGASYYSSVQEEDFRLDWSWEAEKLRRWVTITPGKCFCEVAGRRVFFLDAEAVGAGRTASPGQIIAVGRTRCTVGAGTGAVRLHRAKLGQGDVLPMPELCRRLGLQQGDSLA